MVNTTLPPPVLVVPAAPGPCRICGTVTLASIAGVIGGGLLGHQVAKSQRQPVAYQITVRMKNGASEVVESSTMPPWRIGDAVRLVNGSVVLR